MSDFGDRLETALRSRRETQAAEVDRAREQIAAVYGRVSDLVLETQAALTASEEEADIELSDITDVPQQGGVRFIVETQRSPDDKVLDVITFQLFRNGLIEVVGLDRDAAATMTTAGTGTARAVLDGEEDELVAALEGHLFRYLTS
jgi:hypothetical protein